MKKKLVALSGLSRGMSKSESLTTTNEKCAFTLAEVLITLGIIGVVAAMTLPGLIQKQEEISTITKYKKMYSSLANAHNSAVAKYGDPEDWDITTPKQVLERYGEFLKVNEKCYEKIGCISFGDFVALNGMPRYGSMNTTQYNKIRLNGGFSLFTFEYKPGCEYDAPFTDADGNQQIQHVTNDCGTIHGVITETKTGRKNLLGKDHFMFIITPKGLYPSGYTSSDLTVKKSCSKTETGVNNTNGSYCGTYILRWGNMDYLK